MLFNHDNNVVSALCILSLNIKIFGLFQIYVDGIEKAHATGYGVLDTDWGYKACIGSFDFDGRYLNGEMDNFQMFDYAINDKFQIDNLIKSKCDEQLIK